MPEEPMRALSVRQPKSYLAGVLKGDGWLSAGHRNSVRGYLCLRVADLDFAEAFAGAIGEAYGVSCRPRTDERGYWLTRTYSGYGRFDELLALEPATSGQMAAWLRGLFDSEGNAQLLPNQKNGPGSYWRRVAVYSTNSETLARAANYLTVLGIDTRLHQVHASAGHKGTRQVWELAVCGGRDAYALFADKIGSSVTRKQQVLSDIPRSYCGDLAALTRLAQRRGAELKRQRQQEALPGVLAQIRALAGEGARITRNGLAAGVPGYWSQDRVYGYRVLVEMACGR